MRRLLTSLRRSSSAWLRSDLCPAATSAASSAARSTAAANCHPPSSPVPDLEEARLNANPPPYGHPDIPKKRRPRGHSIVSGVETSQNCFLFCGRIFVFSLTLTLARRRSTSYFQSRASRLTRSTFVLQKDHCGRGTLARLARALPCAARPRRL